MSIVGQYHVVGPLSEPTALASNQPGVRGGPRRRSTTARGHKLSWRRMDANAEGQVDLAALLAGDPKQAAYASTPFADSQKARLVLDTPAEVAVWLNGKPVALSAARPESASQDRTSTYPRARYAFDPHRQARSARPRWSRPSSRTSRSDSVMRVLPQ